MKLIFKATNSSVHLPRKAKEEAKKEIAQKLCRASLHGLHKIIIGKHPNAFDRDCAIYGEETYIEYDKIFPEINTETNYLAGRIKKHPSIFFLIEIGELVQVVGKFEMLDFPKEKRIVVFLK